jgi:tetratricopeptide (TPR) repeat protein
MARVPRWVLPVLLLGVAGFGVWFFVFRESRETRALRLYAQAGQAVDAKDDVSAERELLEAQRFAPSNPRIMHLLGSVYQRQARSEQARLALQRAVELYGPQDAKLRSEALFQLAQVAFDGERYGDAAQHLEAAIAANPTQAILHVRLLDLQLSQLPDSTASDSTTSRFLRLCGRTPQNLVRVAYVHYRRAWYRRCERLARQAVALDDTLAEAHSLVAQSLWKRKRIDEGLAYLEGPLRRYPRATELWTAKGSLLEGTQKHDEAIAALDRALELAPDNYDAHYARLVAYTYSYRTQLALAEVETCLRLTQDPGEHEALTSRRRSLQAIVSGGGTKPGVPAASPTPSPTPAAKERP